MKIGILCTASNPVPPKNYGGTQGEIWELTEQLIKMKHEVMLFAPPDSETSAELIELRPGWGQHIEEFNFMHHVEPQLPFIDVLLDNTAFMHAGNKYPDLPYISKMNGDTNKRYCCNCDRNFVFNSRRHLEFHSQGDCACGRKRGKLGCVTPVILPPVAFRYTGLDEEMIMGFRENSFQDYYLYLGLMAEHKGPHIAIDIAEALDLKLWLVGPKAKSDYFEKKIKPRLTDNIQYKEAVGGIDKWRVLAKARAMIIPTNCEEGGGNVPREAMLAGVPILGICGNIEEITQGFPIAVLCDTKEEMIDRFDELKDIDPVIAHDMILYGECSVENEANQYLHQFQRAIDGEVWI